MTAGILAACPAHGQGSEVIDQRAHVIGDGLLRQDESAASPLR